MAPGPLVAVVEDDEVSRRTLARVLRVGGFDAAMYGSAEEFLTASRDSSAIGLLDIHLGGMSGIQLQQQLQREGSTLPVIVITGLHDQQLEDQSRRLGCRAYLHKPCEAETILELLRALIEHPPNA